MDRLRIREAIVAEGRDDQSAILRAADAQVITTHGFGIRPETLELIEKAYNERGIIILTDPDRAGEDIRRRLSALFPGAKQAYIARTDATKAGDIGVENASPEIIAEALKLARAADAEPSDGGELSSGLMYALGLSGGEGSMELREAVGKALGIGGGNASAFRKKLVSFGISREELIAAWKSSRKET